VGPPLSFLVARLDVVVPKGHLKTVQRMNGRG